MSDPNPNHENNGHHRRIIPAPLRGMDFNRPDNLHHISDRLRPTGLPTRPVTLSLWERATLWVDDTVTQATLLWKLTRLTIAITAASIKQRLAMNNDQKATILGWAKTILIAVGTIFFAGQIADITGTATLVVGAIGSVWAAVEAIQGIVINKPDKK